MAYCLVDCGFLSVFHAVSWSMGRALPSPLLQQSQRFSPIDLA